RFVRVYVPRRTIHASCESPCHLLAKHHLLGTCFPRMAPFRSMLLTLRGGPQCLAPRAHPVPVYRRSVIDILTVRFHGAPPVRRTSSKDYPNRRSPSGLAAVPKYCSDS